MTIVSNNYPGKRIVSIKVLTSYSELYKARHMAGNRPTFLPIKSLNPPTLFYHEPRATLRRVIHRAIGHLSPPHSLPDPSPKVRSPTVSRSKFKSFSMSTSSGRPGYCSNRSCRHSNNEHTIRRCRPQGCRAEWKRCQITGKCNGVHWRSASLVRIIRGQAFFEEEINPKSAEDERNAIS